MLLEGIELIGPERLHLIEPRLKGRERLRSQVVQVHAGIARDAFVRDQPTRSQLSQMLAHRRSAHASGGSQLTRAARPLAEQFHDVPPGRVRKRCKQIVKISNHYGK